MVTLAINQSTKKNSKSVMGTIQRKNLDVIDVGVFIWSKTIASSLEPILVMVSKATMLWTILTAKTLDISSPP